MDCSKASTSPTETVRRPDLIHALVSSIYTHTSGEGPERNQDMRGDPAPAEMVRGPGGRLGAPER